MSEKPEGWKALEEFLLDEGAEKLVEGLRLLPPLEFVKIYPSIAEYVRPKVQRADVDKIFETETAREGITVTVVHTEKKPQIIENKLTLSSDEGLPGEDSDPSRRLIE